MRKMRKGKQEVEIHEWFITSNGWEYYVIDPKADKNTILALVLGVEREVGYVYMPEVSPYITARAEGEGLKELMPAEGWEWV